MKRITTYRASANQSSLTLHDLKKIVEETEALGGGLGITPRVRMLHATHSGSSSTGPIREVVVEKGWV